MSQMEDDRYFRIPRGNLKKEFETLASRALVDAEWESLNLFNLMKVFQKVMLRFEEGPKTVVHKIYNYQFDIEQEQEKVINKIKRIGKASFEVLFEDCENRIHAIIIFLGILELVNFQRLTIVKGESPNQFWLEEKLEIPVSTEEE
jgi:segregation and condensation protein A